MTNALSPQALFPLQDIQIHGHSTMNSASYNLNPSAYNAFVETKPHVRALPFPRSVIGTFASKTWSYLKENKTSIAMGALAGFATRSVILSSFSAAAVATTAPFTLTGAATLIAIGAAAGAVSGVARETFSKKEKKKFWIVRAALKGACGGAAGGFLGGAARDGIGALNEMGLLDGAKGALTTTVSFFKEAATSLTQKNQDVWTTAFAFWKDKALALVQSMQDTPQATAFSSPPLLTQETMQPTSVETIPDGIAPETLQEAPPLPAQEPSPAVPQAEPNPEPEVKETPQTPQNKGGETALAEAKTPPIAPAPLPVPYALEDIVPADSFNKLPLHIQKEAIVAFKTNNQKAILHSLKEISFMMLNRMGEDAQTLRCGADLVLIGANKALEEGLSETLDGKRLCRDAGALLLTGRGTEKDILRGIGLLSFADPGNKLLAFAKDMYPAQFDEVQQAMTPDIMEAIRKTPLKMAAVATPMNKQTL